MIIIMIIVIIIIMMMMMMILQGTRSRSWRTRTSRGGARVGRTVGSGSIPPTTWK